VNYPIPPETEAFCWFFFNGCCNSTVPCGIPPVVMFLIAMVVLSGVLFAFSRRFRPEKKEITDG
jgi:hypothetical protein